MKKIVIKIQLIANLKLTMKKLVPMLLVGVFMLTGSDVFANNLIEKSELIRPNITFTNIQFEDGLWFNEWIHTGDKSQIVTQQLESNIDFLNVQIVGNHNEANFISYTDISAILSKVAYLNGFEFNTDVYWNGELTL